MDPDEWVIFAYDGVPTHRDPAIPPPPPYVHASPSGHRGTGIKLSESDNQVRLLASGNSKTYG